jgi:hypothetical protein
MFCVAALLWFWQFCDAPLSFDNHHSDKMPLAYQWILKWHRLTNHHVTNHVCSPCPPRGIKRLATIPGLSCSYVYSSQLPVQVWLYHDCKFQHPYYTRSTKYHTPPSVQKSILLPCNDWSLSNRIIPSSIIHKSLVTDSTVIILLVYHCKEAQCVPWNLVHCCVLSLIALTANFATVAQSALWKKSDTTANSLLQSPCMTCLLRWT